ncbi:MAG TPA: hypothetical protein VFX59_14050 [Polyangiales bacterium]|nr:hypothetical protein [Polyangiales bacterium]
MSLVSRWGLSVDDPTVEDLRHALDELDEADDEHPDAWVSHESGWTLSAFGTGLLIWSDLESSHRHMLKVSRSRMLALWMRLRDGDLAAVEAEPWQPGTPSTERESD